MAKNKYTIKYTETFVNQFNNILKYFIYKLQNKIAAENLYEEVIKEKKKLGYKAEMTVKGGVLVDLGGEDSDNAVMVDTHIDTLGGMVAEIKSNGNLRIVPIGGLNANNTEAENVRVITRSG